MAEWSNWAGNVTATPSHVAEPRTAAEVVELVRDAGSAAQRVRPVGAGHSFSPIARPDGVQVRLTNFQGIVNIDRSTNRVRIKAGTPLHQLTAALAAEGLALPNMGDIDRQTISGAISTSTHGTGLQWTGFGGCVVGGEMVTGAGEVLRWSEGGANGELTPALAVGLGALGILTEVEMQCVPAFVLHASEAPSTLTEELAALDRTLADVDHYEFYWFPHTDRVMTKRNTRLDGASRTKPLPRWKYAIDDEFLSNNVFEIINRVCVRRPGLTRHVNRVSASALSAREFSDASHTVYSSPRRVRFRETELSVPLEACEPILRELQDWVERTRTPVAFPVEVRWAAGDDRWMSTAYGEPRCYIAAHHYWRQTDTTYFERFWQIGREYGARPHWGKMHDYDAEYLRSVYPRFDDFVALRDRFDPQRVLTNDHLDRVLGG